MMLPMASVIRQTFTVKRFECIDSFPKNKDLVPQIGQCLHTPLSSH